MFGERLISGIILLAVTIFVILTGGNVLFVTVGVLSLMGLFELYRALKIEKSPVAIWGYAGSILFDGILFWKGETYAVTGLMLFLLVLLAIYVFCFPKYTSEHITMVFFGLCYVTVMLSYIYRLRITADGIFMVWLIFIGSWGSDTCAYCVGKLIGKHRLPGNLKELSPKKSLEGCLGGIAGAALIGFLYACFAQTYIISVNHPKLAFAVIGAASAVISQIGDLAASAIKRNHAIKDYGRLIPGHGGILDRFDSVIFTAPLVYFLTIWMSA